MYDHRKRSGFGFDRARQRIAAKCTKANHFFLDDFAGAKFETFIVEVNERSTTLDDGSLFGEVKVGQGNVLEIDVLPHIELGPVGERENTNALSGLTREL